MKRKTYLESSWLKRKVQLEIILPVRSTKEAPGLLLLNDGQDADKLGLLRTISNPSLYGRMRPFITVAIHAGERKSEYGVSGYPDYLHRGSKAGLYENFIKDELIPFLEKHTGTIFHADLTCIAGCSLGGLSAFDIAVSNQHIFGSAGVFSGSFWWRSKSYPDGYTENDRIMFRKIDHVILNDNFRCWLMAGTDDERCDRNRNGVIDSVDDTLDMYDILCSKTGDANQNIAIKIVQGGRHDTFTWEKYFPEFLMHAFGNKIYQ